MTLPIALLSAAAALCAALTIAAKYRQSKRLEYVCKPLATASILLIALLAEDPLTARYQALIILRLACVLGCVPDAAGSLPARLSFLVAHLCISPPSPWKGRHRPLWYLAPSCSTAR